MTLIGAEIVKLVRRRGLMAWAALLTLGSVVVPYAVLLLLHAIDPARHGPAGAGENPQHVLGMLALVGGVAGLLVSTTAGAQDHSSGVFRDLVLTGRSRAALFLARVGGALAIYVPLVAVAFGLAVGAAFAFAGDEPSVLAGQVPAYAAWTLATALLNVALGVALATAAGSRVAIGVLLAWNAIVAPLLLQLRDLGDLRGLIGNAAAQDLAPAGPATASVGMSTGAALLVLAVWLALPLLAGARVTRRRDA